MYAIEQIEILGNREGEEEKLTWADIQKMKYTWGVAQELTRAIPFVIGYFRKRQKDTQLWWLPQRMTGNFILSRLLNNIQL